MTTQILRYPTRISNFHVASPEPICAFSRDYGFDFDFQDQASGSLVTPPTILATETRSEGILEEFEQTFRFFLS